MFAFGVLMGELLTDGLRRFKDPADAKAYFATACASLAGSASSTSSSSSAAATAAAAATSVAARSLRAAASASSSSSSSSSSSTSSLSTSSPGSFTGLSHTGDDDLLSMLVGLLNSDPAKRPSAAALLSHSVFAAHSTPSAAPRYDFRECCLGACAEDEHTPGRHVPSAGMECRVPAWFPDQDTHPPRHHFVCFEDLEGYVASKCRGAGSSGSAIPGGPDLVHLQLAGAADVGELDMGHLRARGGHIWCPGKLTLRTQAQADAARENATKRAREAKVAEPAAKLFRVGSVVDCSCVSEPYDSVELARVLSKGTFEMFLAAKELWTKMQVEEAKDAEFRQRLLREQAEWLRMSEEERQIRAETNEIRESILNCTCPKCKQVFQDFEGCFALKCCSCNTAFCGWCLADCKQDAHAHVLACARNKAPNRGYYAHGSLFEQAQQRRRAELLLAYLRDKVAPARAQSLVRRLLKDLLDLSLVQVLRAFPNVVSADKSHMSEDERRNYLRWEREALDLIAADAASSF